MHSLTHVCMWTEHGWKRVSEEEAHKIYPYKVQTSSRIFMCELCHQYVFFAETKGNRSRYFGHSRGEDKSCPERTYNRNPSLFFKASTHDLPLKIRIMPGGFEFEIGLPGISASILDDLPDDATLQINGNSYALKERLQGGQDKESCLIYIPVGSVPCDKYQVILNCRDYFPFSHWPDTVDGVNSGGTIFAASTGKRLSNNANVEIGEIYYLLQAKGVRLYHQSIEVKSIFSKDIAGKRWSLYRVKATVFNEHAAKFFLDYRCVLSERPISIQPIWPVYRKAPYAIQCNRDEIVFFCPEGIQLKTNLLIRCQSQVLASGEKLVRIPCQDRQQLVSIGRTRMLEYTYLGKDELGSSSEMPTISVTDISGNTICPGYSWQLPKRQTIFIRAEYDGAVLKKKGHRVLEKMPIRANESYRIDLLTYGLEICVLQGLDCVWSITFQRSKTLLNADEDELLRRLRTATGRMIPAPHAWGAAAQSLSAYPKIRRWLYQKIREGYMPASAYQKLKDIMKNLVDNRGDDSK